MTGKILKFRAFRDRVGGRFADPAASLAQALRQAWGDAASLLLRPFDAWRWVKLSLVCLLLGGGTPSAAFNWSLGALPQDISLRVLLDRIREGMMDHGWLVLPVIALGFAIGLSLFYVRSLGRFVLVDSILRRDVQIHSAWTGNRALGRSYFFFLVSALAIMGSVFAAAALALSPHLQSRGSDNSLGFPLVVAGLLGSVVMAGALLALAITLTDDFVVPMMYAERVRLPNAWGELLHLMGREPAAFGIYILVRIGLSVVIGAAVLFFLFPMLLAIFWGAMLVRTLSLVALHGLGLVWMWNAVTLGLALGALGLLSGTLLVALSVAGMPGQVFIQDFGIRFIASRVHPLGAMLSPAADDDQPGDQPQLA